MIRVTPNLSPQQVCFCDEYLVSFNAYRSAIAAGYSENTARKGEILHLPKVQEYLRLKMQQRTERMEITHDMILREYAKVAFSSMANYYDFRGDIKPVSELTETEMAAISFIETKKIAEPDGYIVGFTTRIKLHNKMAALDKIARHLGFFNESQEVRGKNQEGEVDAAVASEVDEFEFLDEVEREVVAAAISEIAVDEATVVAQRVHVPFEINEDGLLMDRPARDEGGKIVNLSPVLGRELVDDGRVPDNVEDFVRELLLRGAEG